MIDSAMALNPAGPSALICRPPSPSPIARRKASEKERPNGAHCCPCRQTPAHAGLRSLSDEQHGKTPTQLEKGDRDCLVTFARGILHICPRPKPHYDLPGIGFIGDSRRRAHACLESRRHLDFASPSRRPSATSSKADLDGDGPTGDRSNVGGLQDERRRAPRRAVCCDAADGAPCLDSAAGPL